MKTPGSAPTAGQVEVLMSVGMVLGFALPENGEGVK